MVVYIEAVILDNFFITWLLASGTYRALSLVYSRLRIISAAFLGTLVAVMYPLLPIHFGFLLGLRVGLLLLLSTILFYKKAKMVPSALIFLMFTFTFGGALFAIGLAVHGSVEAALTLPVSNLPPGLIIFGGFLIYMLLKRIMRRLRRVHYAKEYTGKVEIDIFNKTFSGSGFLDTGNMLYESKSDLPVVVLSTKMSLQILGDKGLSALLREQIQEISSIARYLHYTGVDGKKNKMLILKPEGLRFYHGQDTHKLEGAVLGLALSQYGKFAQQYDVILHPAVVWGVASKLSTHVMPKGVEQ